MWFLIVWGRRQREKRLGFVADYCPICRKVEASSVFEKRLAFHVWFIPTERGRVIGHTQICSGCQTESKAYPAQFTDFLPAQGESMEELIERTNPAVREKHATRLGLAEKITASNETLDPALRHRLMMEAFSMAEPHFRSGYGHQGKRILTVALRPLSPTVDEIRVCLQRFRDSGSRMGSRLHSDDVMVWLYPETEVPDPNKFSY